MDKIKAFCFEFPNGNMLCVGSDVAINDLHNHFVIQRELNNSIEHEIWCKRLINNHIYCRFEPKGIHGLYMFLLFYFEMKKYKLWISNGDFNEALFLTNPEKASEKLGLTEAEAEYIKNESVWNGKFLF